MIDGICKRILFTSFSGAKGEEIMAIAYKNQLNSLNLIKNANELIDQHNDQTMSKILIANL